MHWHHIGHVVPDVEVAVTRLGDEFGLRFEPVQRFDLRIRDRGEDRLVRMGVAMSLHPPLRVELFDEVAGSPWTRARGAPLHHFSYVVADNVAEAARLQALGWELEVTGAGPDEVNGFCYLVGPDGLRVEPKTAEEPVDGSGGSDGSVGAAAGARAIAAGAGAMPWLPAS